MATHTLRKILPPVMTPSVKFASLPTCKAVFVDPMECLSVSKLPEGAQWFWEIKLDGYRAIALKADVKTISFLAQKKIPQ